MQADLSPALNVPDASPGSSTASTSGASHSRHLAHHFDSLSQQYATAKLGMWIFLSTEALLFGGLFCAYAVLRVTHPDVVAYGGQHMDRWSGTINTLILACSSLTMALATKLARTNHSRQAAVLLIITFFLGVEFLGIKYAEYSHKFHNHDVWGVGYYEPPEWLTANAGPLESAVTPATDASSTAATSVASTGLDLGLPKSDLASAAAAPTGLAPIATDQSSAQAHSSAQGQSNEQVVAPVHHSVDPARPPGAHLFYGLYFATTGLHALHLIIGLGIVLWLARRAARREFGPTYSTPVELGGLYFPWSKNLF